jgi:hypothetical protein
MIGGNLPAKLPGSYAARFTGMVPLDPSGAEISAPFLRDFP